MREHLALEALAQQARRPMVTRFRPSISLGLRQPSSSHLWPGRQPCICRVEESRQFLLCEFRAAVLYGCGPLREDIARQSSPKGPLAALVQQLFRRLSGRDGQWDYVAPAAVLHQVFLLTNEAAFQPGDSADVLDCCHLFLHSCLSHSGLVSGTSPACRRVQLVATVLEYFIGGACLCLMLT